MMVCAIALTGCATLDTISAIPATVRLNNPLTISEDGSEEPSPTTRALITQAMLVADPTLTQAELDAKVLVWFQENAGEVANIHKIAEREATRVDAINTFLGMISVMLQ